MQVEFAVQMTGPDAVQDIKDTLKHIGTVDIDEKAGRVIINSTMPWIEIQEKIEHTGRKAILSGFGGNFCCCCISHAFTATSMSFLSIIDQSAVAIIKNADNKINGVIRFSTVPPADNQSSGCVVDGVIDGLEPGLHGLHIHECGDISNGCASLGQHYNPRNTRHGSPNDPIDQRHAGDLGNINVNSDGRATFRFIDPVVGVSEIIGRSVVVTENGDDFGTGSSDNSLIDGNSGDRLACGIIARSAGIFQNFKKICACDGVTLWDERQKPLAGADRRKL